MVNLPDSKIVLKNGSVHRIEIWILWKQKPFMTTRIERTDSGFCSFIGEPEQGGRKYTITIVIFLRYNL
ncbi:hypothetical protein ACFL0C_01830, partial [Patescibacteria group bacterium]